jgi:peptide/nickel transport system substrate-binding protein
LPELRVQAGLKTRRALLARFALLGAGTLLAACTPAPGAIVATQPPAAQPATTSAAAAPPAKPQSTTPARTTTVVYAVSSNPATLNPLLDDSGASQSGYELMFEGLVKPDPKTGTPMPSLATSWDQSGDGLTWTFHIRPNVTWHDGQALTADDVKFTFDSIQDPKTRTPYRSRFSNIASFDAPDKSTFTVTLRVADCPFLITTMQTPIVPKHLLSASPDINTDEFNSSRPVGTGPFIFKEWQRSDHLTLTANPNYWQGRPKIDQWVRRTVSDDNVLQALLKTGEIDYGNVSFGAMQELQAVPHLTLQSVASPILITFIAYNLDRPLFQDKRVRQALTHAIDRAAIVSSLLYDQGEVLDSALPSVSWAYTSNVPRFPFDVDAAKRLLNQAGWTTGPDGILQKDGVRFALTLSTNSSNKERTAIATIAQDAWRKVGIDVQTQLMETNAFFAKYQQTRDFDAIVAGGAGLTIDPDQTSFWSSKSIPGGTNFVHYTSPQVDQLLDLARAAPGCDPAARKVYYEQLQQILADDQPFTFLYAAKTGVFINKRLQNVQASSWAGASPFIAWGIKDWTVSN